jgi:uncharacterized protein (DUF305 family)
VDPGWPYIVWMPQVSGSNLGVRLYVVLLVALAAPACASRSAGPSPRADHAELEALYRARADSARLRYTEADARFVTDMLHHHAQAVEMARLVPDRTTDAAIRTLAARILNSQLDEIAIMERWLRDRALPVPAHGDAGAHAHHHAPAASMPGMLRPEQIEELRSARAVDFDRLFLTYMIQHHRGAVVMVRELFATDGAAQDDILFRFASDVQVDQATEVARMERMLVALRSRMPQQSTP